MRILVASTVVPFIRHGGGRQIVDWLVAELRRRDYEVDKVEIPFWPDPYLMVEQMLSLRLLDLRHQADRLICIRTPSYLLRHPDKRVWFIHHHRDAYDLWDSSENRFPRTPTGRSIRDAIVSSDVLGLGEARRIYTNSQVVSDRLARFNAIRAPVLYPPLRDPDRFRCEPSAGYVFAPSRLVAHKRQHLLIEAMAHVRSATRLVVAGPPDDGAYVDRLRSAVARSAADRIELRPEYIPEQEMVGLYARALAVAFVPLDEDSYGYVGLEAAAAHKPLITCSDSGGTLELVSNGESGLIADPEPAAIAAAIDTLAADGDRAVAMGQRAAARIAELGISWDAVVAALAE